MPLELQKLGLDELTVIDESEVQLANVSPEITAMFAGIVTEATAVPLNVPFNPLTVPPLNVVGTETDVDVPEYDPSTTNPLVPTM